MSDSFVDCVVHRSQLVVALAFSWLTVQYCLNKTKESIPQLKRMVYSVSSIAIVRYSHFDSFELFCHSNLTTKSRAKFIAYSSENIWVRSHCSEAKLCMANIVVV